MTTKTSLLTFLALLMTTMIVLADMTSHSPADAVEIARDIAAGVVHVSREKELEVRFTPQNVLKGNMQPGSSYIINYDSKMRFRLNGVVEKIAAHAEGKHAVIFVGWLMPDGRTISPDSFDGAIWPRSTKEPLGQTPDTVEECITFIKALMMNPKLKLKNVNGRRMLPDNYTLPTTSPAAAPDHVRGITYLSPRKAVESAQDIVVGAVQLSHTNGLEMLFTPQTVLKGSMQPGITYVVNYPPSHSYYRDHMEEIVAATERKSAVMLLGRLQPDGKTFEPEGLDSAVWPRSAKWGGVFQTPDTLEECITFVKALLANPDLKLKIVNDRQMLPDGYTLPSASSGAIKSDAATPKAQK